MIGKSDYIDGSHFHDNIKKIFSGTYGWAVNKKASQMAHVVYEGVHGNPDETGDRRGHGKSFVTWLFSEEKGIAENLSQTNFELMLEGALEPHAALGLHYHKETEEIYYVLEGSITMTTISPDGKEHVEELFAGDAHFLRLGQGHCGVAGTNGVRVLAVVVRK